MKKDKQPTLLMWRLFVQAVEKGSLLAVANNVGSDVSYVSRQLKSLEQLLGESLLERSKRGVKPTWFGIMRYTKAKEVVNMADRLFEYHHWEDNYRDTLRVAVPTSLAGLFTQWIASFGSTQDGKDVTVSVEQYATNTTLDFNNFDYFVCEKKLPNVRAIATHLGSVERIIVASADFLKCHAEIQSPEELETVPLIALKKGLYLLQGQKETLPIWVDPTVQVNASSNLPAAAMAGTGYAVGVPMWLIKEELKSGVLKRVLPNWHLEAENIWLLRSPKRNDTRQSKALAQFFFYVWHKTFGLTKPVVASYESTQEH